MKQSSNISLAEHTSFRTGGAARQLTVIESTDEVSPDTVGPSAILLGYGSNSLVSDHGLESVVQLRNTAFEIDGSGLLTADAGAWWDDVVGHSIDQGYWGIELMSGIPSSVGAAVTGAIAAYGQATKDTLLWVDVFDKTSGTFKRISASEITMSYRESSLQSTPNLIVLRIALQLSKNSTRELEYDAALSVANEIQADISSPAGRRAAIMETRRRAGSLWDYREPLRYDATVGSFFKNPVVSPDQVESIIAHDETGKAADVIRKMNRMHTGGDQRVSGAHVLLAAGYSRGQEFGRVRMHPDHLLKLENFKGASSQEIYDVAHEIMHTVRQKLGVELEPEVKFIGSF